MKTERRHELEENLLANWLVSMFRKIQPYQNVFWAAIIVVLLVVVVYSWATRRGAGKAEAAWNEVFTNMAGGRDSPQLLEKAAENHAGTEPAQWAALLAAEAYLAKACDALFQNKTEARQYLNQSRKLFEGLLNQARNEVIRERATFGLARADEAAGDLDKAMESWSSPSAKQAGQKADRGYKGLLNLWPDGPYAEAAKQRLEDLQRYRTKKFYDDFARWEPPIATSQPLEGSKTKPSPELPIPEGPVYTPGELLKSKPEAPTSESQK